MPEYEYYQFALVLYSLAKLRHRPDALWAEAYFNYSLPHLPRFSPQNVSNVIWALGALRLEVPPNGPWLATLLDQAQDCMPQIGNGISQVRRADQSSFMLLHLA